MLISKELVKQLITEQKTQIDISALPPGVYFLRLQHDVTIEGLKIIKE